MIRVALISTGVTEFLGLAPALRSIFPGVDFVTLEERPKRPFNGFTSTIVSKFEPGSTLENLIQEMGGALCPDRSRRKEAADFVVLLEDLELVNAHQPHTVTRVVREAVLAYLQDYAEQRPSTVHRVAQALKERASFHLAVPMIESWFFADPLGLTNAGVPLSATPQIQPGDPEALLITDRSYLQCTGAQCSHYQNSSSLGRVRKNDPPTWLRRNIDRAHHPKAYICWLCCDDASLGCSSYSESDGGASALGKLNWQAALSSGQNSSYLRSLVDDLADALKVPLPWLAGGHCASATSRRHLPRDPVMRNI